MAARRIRRITRHPRLGPRRSRGRFRGNARGLGGRVVTGAAGGDGVGADVHDDLVDLRVIGGRGLAAQERLRDDQQRVGQAGGRRRQRPARIRFRGNTRPLRLAASRLFEGTRLAVLQVDGM